MANIDNMSPEELNQALLADINAEDNTAELDSTTNDDETSYEEETQEESADEETETNSEEEVEVKQDVKKKSNIKKVLSEKNYWKQKAKELEARSSEYREEDLDYINTTAAKVAWDIIEERDFFKENPDAIEVKDILKSEEYAGLELERAWKLYQLEHNPEELQIKTNKANAKKYNTTWYSSPKLKAEKPVNDLSLEELKARLAQELKAGRVNI